MASRGQPGRGGGRPRPPAKTGPKKGTVTSFKEEVMETTEALYKKSLLYRIEYEVCADGSIRKTETGRPDKKFSMDIEKGLSNTVNAAYEHLTRTKNEEDEEDQASDIQNQVEGDEEEDPPKPRMIIQFSYNAKGIVGIDKAVWQVPRRYIEYILSDLIQTMAMLNGDRVRDPARMERIANGIYDGGKPEEGDDGKSAYTDADALV